MTSRRRRSCNTSIHCTSYRPRGHFAREVKQSATLCVNAGESAPRRPIFAHLSERWQESGGYGCSIHLLNSRMFNVHRLAQRCEQRAARLQDETRIGLVPTCESILALPARRQAQRAKLVLIRVFIGCYAGLCLQQLIPGILDRHET